MNPNEIRKLKEKAPFPLIILVILIILPTFLIEPQEEKLNGQISKYKSLLRKSRKNLKRRKTYKQQRTKLQKLDAVLANINKELPENSKLPEIINAINEVAEYNFVFIEFVRYELNSSFDGLNIPCYTISMSLEADYSNIRHFIAGLESLPNPLILSEIVAASGKNYKVKLKQLVK
ncbi:MAG: type 4a pilus biogenesis protein PilO [Candidatus Rifleibacteriota bacterium]